MKAGIVTYHKAHNYGAVLQAYALARWIRERYSATVEFLDYQPADRKQAYSVFTGIKSLKDLKNNINNLLRYNEITKRRDGFIRFQTQELAKTDKYETEAEIVNAHLDHDFWITGSDQVFRYYGKVSDPYYLSFCWDVKAKSIAYAPSFGASTVDPQYEERVAELLNKIEHLSCRETEGGKLIKKLTGREAELVLDPVFLLDQDQWRELFVAPRIQGKYILVYALVGYKEQLEIAKKLQEHTKLPIYVIYPTKIKDRSVKATFTHADPYEFGGLIDKAEYVVTDSFHGLAFSLVFRKNFFCWIALQHSSSRHKSLLDLIGLAERITENGERIVSIGLITDYSIAGKKLDQIAESSKRYLSGAIEGEKN